MITTGDLNTDPRQPHSGAQDPHAPAVKRADVAGQQSPGDAYGTRWRTRTANVTSMVRELSIRRES